MITYNRKVITYNDKWINVQDPYNPLNLPPNTIRCKFKSGYRPTEGDSRTLVDSTNNIWDIYKQNNFFTYLFDEVNINKGHVLLEVLGANTSNITDMYCTFYGCSSLSSVHLFDTSNVSNMFGMFAGCSSLSNVPIFDTSNVTNMYYMFSGCSNLSSVPLLNTSNVRNMDAMFYGCINVESGALALYNQASSQTNIPGHEGTFYNCGSNTVTGAAELAQIPSSWGGTGT